MKRPKFCDARKGRYRTAEESREPGYLARRFAALRRLERMRQRQAAPSVTKIRKAA